MTSDEWRTFCHDRKTWIAKGEPHDPADPYWARVLARQASLPAYMVEGR